MRLFILLLLVASVMAYPCDRREMQKREIRRANALKNGIVLRERRSPRACENFEWRQQQREAERATARAKASMNFEKLGSAPPRLKSSQTLQEKMIAVYNKMTDLFSSSIVQRLVDVNIDALWNDEAKVMALAKDLACASVKFNDLTKYSKVLTTQLWSESKASLNELMAKRASRSENLANLNQKIGSTHSKISGLTTEIRDLDKHTAATQASLNNYHRLLQIEIDRLNEKQTNCIGKRRRKRGFWKDAWDTFRHGVQLPICSVVNSGGIKRQRQAVKRAAETLNTFKTRRNTAAAQLAAMKKEMDRLVQIRGRLQTERATLDRWIQSNQAAQTVQTELINKYDILTNHIGVLVESSMFIVDFITMLEFTSFTDFLDPMKDIYESLVRYNAVSPSSTIKQILLTSAQQAVMDSNLVKLAASLDDFPILIDDNLGCH